MLISSPVLVLLLLTKYISFPFCNSYDVMPITLSIEYRSKTVGDKYTSLQQCTCAFGTGHPLKGLHMLSSQKLILLPIQRNFEDIALQCASQCRTNSSTTMHFYKCFPLRGQVSPIQAVSMGGSPARGLAILLDIHYQEICSQKIHYQETNFKEKSALRKSCSRISNPAGYPFAGNSCSGK